MDFSKEFEKELIDLSLQRIKVACWLAITLFPIFGILDFFIFPEKLYSLLIIRGLCTVFEGLWIFTLSRPFGKKHHILLGYLVSLTISFSIAIMTLITGGAESPYYAGLNLVLLALGILMPWDYKIAFSVYGIIYLSYLVPNLLIWKVGSLRIFINNNFFLGCSVIIATVANIFSYRLRVNEFNARHDLNTAKLNLEKALNDLKGAETQLVQSAKMASIGQLAAGVAHEINNPVCAVGTELRNIEIDYKALKQEKLSRETFIEQLITQSIPLMKWGLARVDNIVLALRNFSRKDEPGMNTEVKINNELDQILALFNSRMGGHIEVIKEYRAQNEIECNGGNINQVFMNIIANAIEAIGESKGKITIKTEDHNHAILVTIRDTGTGMSEEILKRIFEPFFTTKGTLGTGLGLAISYNIIKDHQGQIIAKSEEGRGTEFSIVIPDQKHIREQKKGDTNHGI